MRRVSWSTALILIAAFLLVPGVWATGLPALQITHPAGCHEHGPMAPSPVPPSHQCCANGHQWAIPGTTFSPEQHAELSLWLPSHVLLCAQVTNDPFVSLLAPERALLSNSSPLRI